MAGSLTDHGQAPALAVPMIDQQRSYGPAAETWSPALITSAILGAADPAPVSQCGQS